MWFRNRFRVMADETSPGPSVAAGWEHFEHGADVGVRGFGSSLEEAFEQAGVALTAVVTDPALVRPSERFEVECEAPDHGLLLMAWLNAIVYEMAIRRMLFGHFRVTIQNHHLQGELLGESVDSERHQPAVEVKGATASELRVIHSDDRWIAQCIVDV